LQELDLRIKWPNDIYYGSKEKAKKIGGVLITSHAMGNIVTAAIGVLPSPLLHRCVFVFS